MCYKYTIPAVFAGCFILAGAGCTNIGPGTIGRDRFNYVDAIGDSWKRQTLLNTVKIRYADAPVFVDVSSIVSQYSLVTQVNGILSWDALLPGNSQSIGGSSIYADRPTITYQAFARREIHAESYDACFACCGYVPYSEQVGRPDGFTNLRSIH